MRAPTCPLGNEGGVRGRLVAGEADGIKAAVRTHSPLFYQHWEMNAGARRAVTTAYAERVVYCASGTIEVDGTILRPGQMAVTSGRDRADVARVKIRR